MLQSTLSRIDKLIRDENIVNESQLSILLDLLSNYKLDMWIYPGVIKRKLGISVSETYNILHIIQKEDFIDSYYELYCNNCQKSSGIVVNTLSEMPQSFQCDVCDAELPALENAMLIYKVIKE